MADFQKGGLVEQMAVIATAAGTTTLTVTSKQIQIFTGSTTQTIVLPDATTMVVGQKFELINQSSGSLTLQFNGGTSFTDASGTLYNVIAPKNSLFIILQTNGTAAGTWAILNSTANVGSVICTDWVSYTPTIGAVTTAPTPGTNTYTARWRRIGDSMEIEQEFAQTSGGSAGSGTYLLPLPSGYTMDSSKMTFYSGGGQGEGATMLGITLLNNNNTLGNATAIQGYVVAYNSTNFRLFAVNGNQVSQFASSNFALTTSIINFSFRAMVPITGWTSNVGGLGGGIAPTIQKLTSGSGTYTTPANVAFLKIRMVGGGSGGTGCGTPGTYGAGGNGGSTTFGSSLLTCTGGQSGGSNASPSTGGTATINSPAIGTPQTGACTSAAGMQPFTGNSFPPSTAGAASPFGGNGVPTNNGSGGAASANSGSGGAGGGGGSQATNEPGQGGSSGGFIDAIITAPSATYSYAIGTGGSAGTAGTNGNAGGAGGSGYIEVTEFYYNGAVGTATNVTGIVAVANGGTGTANGFATVYISEQQSNGTNGGTFTSGAWRTRVLNTISDFGTSITISSNQMIIPAGTWEIYAAAPAHDVNSNQAKLKNITDSTDTIIGQNARTGSDSDSIAIVQGRFTIAAQKTFEIQHQCQTTNAANGLGVAASFSVGEVYTQVKIIKVS